MGVVDLVHDTVRDQVVARKRMLADSAEARLLFKREFRAVESLRHPNIVVLHELEGDAGGARARLAQAEREAERRDMPFDVARARHQRGKLLGGAAGAALVASARDLAASVGASERVLERLP